LEYLVGAEKGRREKRDGKQKKPEPRKNQKKNKVISKGKRGNGGGVVPKNKWGIEST